MWKERRSTTSHRRRAAPSSIDHGRPQIQLPPPDLIPPPPPPLGLTLPERVQIESLPPPDIFPSPHLDCSRPSAMRSPPMQPLPKVSPLTPTVQLRLQDRGPQHRGSNNICTPPIDDPNGKPQPQRHPPVVWKKPIINTPALIIRPQVHRRR
uniref:Uncharacterized protein n=1 Tax=Arundo donax TaxID=35708 RepID=A0A0A8ZUX3_ARUDO